MFVTVSVSFARLTLAYPNSRTDVGRDLISGQKLAMLGLRALAVTTVFTTLFAYSAISLARDPATRYEQTRPSADGIGKRYMGREIARVIGWQGAQWLERVERVDEERPDLLLPALDLKPGMVVARVRADGDDGVG